MFPSSLLHLLANLPERVCEQNIASPFLVGWIKDATGSTDLALYILSSVMLAGALLVLRVPAKLVNR